MFVWVSSDGVSASVSVKTKQRAQKHLWWAGISICILLHTCHVSWFYSMIICIAQRAQKHLMLSPMRNLCYVLWCLAECMYEVDMLVGISMHVCLYFVGMQLYEFLVHMFQIYEHKHCISKCVTCACGCMYLLCMYVYVMLVHMHQAYAHQQCISKCVLSAGGCV